MTVWILSQQVPVPKVMLHDSHWSRVCLAVLLHKPRFVSIVTGSGGDCFLCAVIKHDVILHIFLKV